MDIFSYAIRREITEETLQESYSFPDYDCLPGSSGTSHLLIRVLIIMDYSKVYKAFKGVLTKYYLCPLIYWGKGWEVTGGL